VLEPETFDRIPKDTAWSIERSYFPSLIERGETFVAYVYDGYWIDIGTPAKYLQVHRDIMDGRFVAPPFDGAAAGAGVARRQGGGGRRDRGALLRRRGGRAQGGRAGAALLGHRPPDARRGRGGRRGAIVWPNGWIGRDAAVRGAILGRNCHIGRNAVVESPVVLGDKTVITDYSRL
jgi:NDP-sugar pyrophosphorylase family protein